MNLRSKPLYQFTIILIALISSPLSYGQTLDWVFSTGSTGDDQGYSITSDDSGYIYQVGTFDYTVDMNQDSASFYLKSAGSNDIFIRKLRSDSTFVWARRIGNVTGNLTDVARSVVVDAQGDINILGMFEGTVDFDPGDSVYNLTSSNKHLFVLKLSPDGEFIKVAATSGSGNIYRSEKLAADTSGNIYAVGAFRGTVDFDPGPSGHSLTAGPSFYEDAFVLKLDTALGFVWAKQIGASQSDYAYDVAVGPDNEPVITGYFQGVVDMDPGSGTRSRTSNGYLDIFILKLSAAGQYRWDRVMGSSSTDEGFSVTIDQFNNIYCTGIYRDTLIVSTTKGPDTLLSQSPTNYVTMYLLKCLPDGKISWAKSIQGTDHVEPKTVAVDSFGNSFVTGTFQGRIDFDPTAGFDTIRSRGSGDIFLVKYNTYGNYEWGVTSGGGSMDWGREVDIDHRGDILLTGWFEKTGDFDFSKNTRNLTSAGGIDVFTQKLIQDSCFYFDYSFEQLVLATCSDSAEVVLIPKNGYAPYSISWDSTGITSDSISARIKDGGIYAFRIEDSIGCVIERKVLIKGPVSKSGFDLRTETSIPQLRPGFDAEIFLNGFNDACDTVSGEMTFLPDKQVTITGSSIPYTKRGDTLVWAFRHLSYDSGHISPRLKIRVSTRVRRGDTLKFDLNISPDSNDIIPANNHRKYKVIAVNSYDPNDITVYPAGVCDQNYIAAVQPVTYRIRFQNTGSADAVNVIVDDTLPTAFDIDSIRILATSHDILFTEVLPDHLIRFNFKGIHLPDSSSSPDSSQGYVIFQVPAKQKLSLPLSVTNKAHIYFDFNEPIITNTVLSTLIDTLPSADTNRMVIKACNSYTWVNGKTYYNNVSNEMYVTRTKAGCDSVLILDLTLQNNTGLDTVRACDSYTSRSGRVYTSSVSVKDTFANQYGCDSIVRVAVIVNRSTSNMWDVVSSCDSALSPSAKYIYHKSGVYYDTITNMAGCDSVLRQFVTILESTKNETVINACDSFISSVGKTYRKSAVFTDTLVNAQGCDSLLTTDLTILHSTSSFMSLTGCDSLISPAGRVIRSSGNYFDILVNSAGCDSTVKLDVTINKTVRSNENAQGCKFVVSPTGKSWFSSGQYYDTLASATGCDSIIRYDVNISDYEILSQPSDRSGHITDSLHIYWTDFSNETPEYQWQVDTGKGYTNLVNNATYDAVTSKTLVFKVLDTSMQRYTYRCVVQAGVCSDTTEPFSVTVSTVSIQQLNELAVTVYPNPVTSLLHVRIDHPGTDYGVKIFNELGVCVYNQQHAHRQFTIDLPGGSGVYWLEIRKDGADGGVSRFKVVRF